MADLIVEHVSKEYPTPTSPLVILRDINLSLAAGESLAIVGPSGSGKSTLLHLIGTLERPTGGRIALQGQDPFALAESALAEFRNRRLGFVFQDHHLLPQLTAWENVVVPCLAQGSATREEAERARELLARVGLQDRMHHRPSELSGGERQRVAIARALIREPLLILADEPTGNLDRSTALEIAELLGEIQHQVGRAMILMVVTHSLALARRMATCQQLDAGNLKPFQPGDSTI